MTKQETNELMKRMADSLYSLSLGEPWDHDKLIENAVFLSKNPKYESLKDKIEDVVKIYEVQYGIQPFTKGSTLLGDDQPKDRSNSWLYYKKENIDHNFEERYREYLLSPKEGKFGEAAVDYIFDEAEKILSLCANPESPSDQKLGLVMGDVQSGKTANYLALASMACDYGYKVILILSGINETLRIQTQQRVDDALIGAVSSSLKNSTIDYLFTGKLSDPYSNYAVPFTTDKADFEASTVTPNDLNKPQILVVKKNRKILENVRDWLKPGQSVSSNNILIIDDECDNASVNTRDDASPTTINRLIREIFNNFACATYVGYTATPFANIFINPDDKDTFRDLFPRDFIHRLKTTSDNYFGIKKVFQGDDSHLIKLDRDKDGSDFIEAVHKKDLAIYRLPSSLKDAICVFLLDNCVRTLRGDKHEHRSMMINVSRFNNIQFELEDLVFDYVKELRILIPNYDAYSTEIFCKHEELKRIYDLYNKDGQFEQARKEFSFREIQNLLNEEIQQFVVSVYNTSVKKDDLFDYNDYKGEGARVIIIGGFALSRGLTLRGLMVSYYNRHSEAYDTLLQMCRWFGYRPNYEDLCKIYMTDANYDCFQAVISAVEDLDTQFENMAIQGKTPDDFGLMVLESPDILETKLTVTARNKSKHAGEIETNVNFSGTICDTTKLFSDPDKIQKNDELVRNFIVTLTKNGYNIVKMNNRYVIKNVPASYIANMVGGIKAPYENHSFNVQSLSSFIEEQQYFSMWDVSFATGNEKKGLEKYILKDFNGNKCLSIFPSYRSFSSELDDDIITFYKSNNRFIGPALLSAGLNEDQLKIANQNINSHLDENGQPTAPSPKDYLNIPGRNPLLIILPVALNPNKTDDGNDISEYKEKIIAKVDSSNAPLIGFGIAIPGSSDQKIMLKYRANVRKIQEEYKEVEEDEEPVR